MLTVFGIIGFVILMVILFVIRVRVKEANKNISPAEFYGISDDDFTRALMEELKKKDSN